MLMINKNNCWRAVIIPGIIFSSVETMAETLIEYRHKETNANSFQSSHHPRLTLSAEAIVFDRVGTATYTLVERVPGTAYFLDIPATSGSLALKSTNLKQGFSPGYRLGAAYRFDSNHDVLFSFFHIDDWNSTRSIGPDNPPNWLIMRAPGGFFQTQDFTYQSMTWGYSTKLYNAELNVQKKFHNRIVILVGFRWLQLRENLLGIIQPRDLIKPTWKSYPKADLAYVKWFEGQPGIPAPVYPPFWNTSATNNLYGLQIGVDGKLFERSSFFLNGLVKIGGYLNHATESTGVSIAKVVYNSRALTNQSAFVGEAGLQCAYQITNNIALKLSYEVLWLTNIATAPGQIQKTYSTQSSVNALGVNSASNVFFNGGTVGLELSF